MKAFYKILANTLLANIVIFSAWFALIYWAYLETKSVITTSIIGGVFAVITAISGFWLGSIVDHHKKKQAMLFSSFVTFILFTVSWLLLQLAPTDAFKSISSPWLWVLIITLLLGATAGNIRGIALPTVVALIVPEDQRDKANGISGTIFGIAFAIANVCSGLALGIMGMQSILGIATLLTLLVILHLNFLDIPEKRIISATPETTAGKVDIKGTIATVKKIPGLFGLIFFTTFNNFLGGIFMSLMDAYGLSLVSVEIWGTLWGFLSLGFIFGGLYIAKKGLGNSPLRTLFLVNIALWIISIIFPIQPSILLLTICIGIYMTLVPFIEASENTIIQKVVPKERMGRVFGFAQSIEQAASPIMAFLVGPIAQYIFIPFMTS